MLSLLERTSINWWICQHHSYNLWRSIQSTSEPSSFPHQLDYLPPIITHEQCNQPVDHLPHITIGRYYLHSVDHLPSQMYHFLLSGSFSMNEARLYAIHKTNSLRFFFHGFFSLFLPFPSPPKCSMIFLNSVLH